MLSESVVKRSRAHSVEKIADGTYRVESGTSDRVYDVAQDAEGKFTCSCVYGRAIAAGERKPGSACSHVKAVRDYVAGNRPRAGAVEPAAPEREERKHAPRTAPAPHIVAALQAIGEALRCHNEAIAHIAAALREIA